jgi:hypothetical protein
MGIEVENTLGKTIHFPADKRVVGQIHALRVCA